MNQVMFSGKIFRDPEAKKVGDKNVLVANFGILNEDGSKSYLIGCEAWGAVGKKILDTLKQDDEVLVVGSLNQSSWDDNGKKRSLVRIRVTDFTTPVPVLTAESNDTASSNDGGDIPF